MIFHDNLVVAATDAANPAARWIATYENESKLAVAIDPEPRPFGSFGANENGLSDVAGNVWEWTDTCFARHSARKDHVTTVVESCGVRVVEGNHRTYVTDFIRDPKGGACAVGTPPSNLGIRLVREEGGCSIGLPSTSAACSPRPARHPRTPPDLRWIKGVSDLPP
jgi:formylglycine-generating enzyme required for sulfatase activity